MSASVKKFWYRHYKSPTANRPTKTFVFAVDRKSANTTMRQKCMDEGWPLTYEYMFSEETRGNAVVTGHANTAHKGTSSTKVLVDMTYHGRSLSRWTSALSSTEKDVRASLVKDNASSVDLKINKITTWTEYRRNRRLSVDFEQYRKQADPTLFDLQVFSDINRSVAYELFGVVPVNRDIHVELVVSDVSPLVTDQMIASIADELQDMLRVKLDAIRDAHDISLEDVGRPDEQDALCESCTV